MKKTRRSRKQQRLKEIALSLFEHRAGYLKSACTAVANSKDPANRHLVDLVAGAIHYQQKVRELFAYIEPKTGDQK